MTGIEIGLIIVSIILAFGWIVHASLLRCDVGELRIDLRSVERARDWARGDVSLLRQDKVRLGMERDRLLHLLKISVASTPDAMETINTSIRKAKWLDKRQLVVVEDGHMVDMWLEKPGERGTDPEPEVYR